MKSMKKFMALLLVVVLTLALATTAFAAGTDPSITVNGTTKDKTYDIYKIFDLTYSDVPAQGTEGEPGYVPASQNVSYEIDSDWVNFFIGTGAPGAGYLLSAQPAGGSLNQLTYNGSYYYINITESNVADFAQDALAWCADNSPAADASKTADGTTLTFAASDGVTLGYYLVYPQGATDVADSYASLCSLTSTVPTAEVNVKATYPEIDKTVDDESVEVGQTVTFTVTGQVPDTTGYSYYKYEVKDTMSAGLTFTDAVDNIKVTFGSTEITVPETGKVTYTIANNGFDLVFDMTKYQTYKGQDITITYDAVVNDAAVATLTENGVTLTYSNDPANANSTETTPEIEVQVYTSEIVIDKYDGADDTKKLSGAKFVLVKKTTDGGSTTETFYKYTAATASAAAKVEWVSSLADATVVETVNGAAEFNGLEDGTYYLRETVAPKGFNLLTEDTTVTIAHTTTSDDKPIGISQEADVANNAGTVLPETGGFGTTMLIVLGSVLFMATAIVLVTKKRMYNEG